MAPLDQPLDQASALAVEVSAPCGPMFSIEIDVAVEGQFIPGYPERGPSYDCGGEPAEPDSIEDLEATALWLTVVDRKVKDGKWSFSRRYVNLMDGVNAKAPDVQRLLENIIEACRDEAESAVLEASL